MKKYFYLLAAGLMAASLTSCGNSTTAEEKDTAQIEQQDQESIREANERAEAERIKKEQEEQARLEAEREAKKWKGATSLSEFKSKLPGTSWGATRQRGDFYCKFEITENKIITTFYVSSDFSEDSKVGEPMVEIIDSWKDLDGQNAFTVTAYKEGADKDDWSTVPTMLAFRKGKPDAQWATVDGTVSLKQIIE